MAAYNPAWLNTKSVSTTWYRSNVKAKPSGNNIVGAIAAIAGNSNGNTVLAFNNTHMLAGANDTNAVHNMNLLSSCVIGDGDRKRFTVVPPKNPTKLIPTKPTPTLQIKFTASIPG